MRAFHGQLSDNQPIRRNKAEKEKQLRELKEALAGMKSHTAPTLRESVQRRIRELEIELRAAARESAAQEGKPERPPRREGRRGGIRSM